MRKEPNQPPADAGDRPSGCSITRAGWPPQLDITHPQIVALSKRLRALHAMPIGTKEEIAAWNAAAGPLRENLHEDCREIYDSLPHEIEHYLVDVDIRAKDPGYAKYQEELLGDLLSGSDEKAV